MINEIMLKWVDTSPDGKSAVLLNENTGRYIVIDKKERFGLKWEQADETREKLIDWARSEIVFCGFNGYSTLKSEERRVRIESAQTVLRLLGVWL